MKLQYFCVFMCSGMLLFAADQNILSVFQVTIDKMPSGNPLYKIHLHDMEQKIGFSIVIPQNEREEIFIQKSKDSMLDTRKVPLESFNKWDTLHLYHGILNLKNTLTKKLSRETFVTKTLNQNNEPDLYHASHMLFKELLHAFPVSHSELIITLKRDHDTLQQLIFEDKNTILPTITIVFPPSNTAGITRKWHTHEFMSFDTLKAKFPDIYTALEKLKLYLSGPIDFLTEQSDTVEFKESHHLFRTLSFLDFTPQPWYSYWLPSTSQ